MTMIIRSEDDLDYFIVVDNVILVLTRVIAPLAFGLFREPHTRQNKNFQATVYVILYVRGN